MPDLQNLLSGYGEFDSKTGGFRRGSVVLCSGTSDPCAEFFSAGVLAHALSEGDGGAIVLATRTPSSFKKAASERGIFFSKFEGDGKFCFIDAYSRLVGAKVEGRAVNGPSDLKGILVSIAEFNSALFRKGVRPFFILDSLSGLAVHNSRDALAVFLEETAGMLKKSGSILFLVFHEPFEDPSLPERISPFVDVRVELKEENGTVSARSWGSEWARISELKVVK